MLQSSLNQLEQLVGELLERNRQLVDTNQQLSGDLARAKEENDTLQLGLMEQEELHNDATARIQALVERASAAHP
jgi:cell division protein ZapB